MAKYSLKSVVLSIFLLLIFDKWHLISIKFCNFTLKVPIIYKFAQFQIQAEENEVHLL